MIVHNLFAYFTKTLTVPKIKDLVNAPAEKYNHIFDIISSNTQVSSSANLGILPDNNSTNISDLTTIHKGELNSMKNELKNFLKKQLKNDSNVLPQQYKEYSNAY
jgi:CRISPR/Cas system CMR subunit Cmr4 (Cas7 group RAMP superfamily)